MDIRAPRATRALASAAVALAVLAGTFSGATAAYAAAQSPPYFDRTDVIGRAARWTRRGVPYSQTSWVDDYRSDCSGFVSYAWGLDRSYVTWSLPEVARPIGKNDLLPGDIILNTARHVIVFGKWANGARTAYLGYEQAGAPRKAVSRVIPYPYDSPTAPDYKPYRYTGGHNLYGPGSFLPGPLVQTYAGSGQVLTPAWANGTNASRVRAAQQRERHYFDQLHAQQRAAAAKAKAEADREARADAEAAADAKAARKATAQAMALETGQPAGSASNDDAASAPVIVQLLKSAIALLGHI